jgi:O-antigen ligase
MTPFRHAFADGPPHIRAAFWLLALPCLVAPLFFVPAAQDSFVTPKWSFLGGMTALVVAAIAAAAALGKGARVALHPVPGFLVLFALWQLASALWEGPSELALAEAGRWGMLVAFALSFQHILHTDRRRLLAVALLFSATSTVLACWTILVDAIAAFAPGRLSVRATLFDWRDAISTASMGNSGHVADFLALGFLCTLALTMMGLGRVRFWLGAASLWLHSAALIVAWSVHSNLSLIVGSGLLVYLLRGWLHDEWTRRRLRRLLPLAAGWALVVAFYVVDHPANPHGSAVWGPTAVGVEDPSGGIFSQAFASPRWQAGAPTRLAIWLTTLQMVQDAPWFGHGAGTFTHVYPATTSLLVSEDPDLAPYASTWTNAAHNDLLQTWAETGIVGAFLLVMLVGSAFWSIARRMQSARGGNEVILATTAAMLTAWCVQAQFSFPLEMPVASFVLMALLGIPVLLPQRGTEGADLMVPAERSYPGLRLGVVLRNMATPAELSVALELPRPLRVAVAALAVSAGFFVAWRAQAPLRASIAYRPVYEMRHAPDIASGPTLDRFTRLASEVLVIDPRHVDCRSALSDVLVRAGRWEEALRQLDLVRLQLNATEVHLREAIAREALGDTGGADAAWAEVFSRDVRYGEMNPAAFNRWVERQLEDSE